MRQAERKPVADLTPIDFARFTRAMPAASSGARSPLSVAATGQRSAFSVPELTHSGDRHAPPRREPAGHPARAESIARDALQRHPQRRRSAVRSDCDSRRRALSR